MRARAHNLADVMWHEIGSNMGRALVSIGAWLYARDSVAVATWVIAFAANLQFWVYRRMAAQIDEQIRLTKNLFLELNRPRLWVDIEGDEFSPMSDNRGRVPVRISITNLGPAAASNAAIWITVTAGGGEVLKQGLTPPVLRAGEKYTFETAITILKNRYQPTLVEAVVHSSYRGIGGQAYTDEEVQTYDLEKRRFVRRELRGENRAPL
jgi:hypothetical protein